MANFEVLSLDPTTPQIRAPGAGDGYSVPRDMTFATGTTLNAPTTVVSVNTSTDALRITQVGAGNALVVEDSANPDATPTVITATGNVGIGITSPAEQLSIYQASATASLGVSLQADAATFGKFRMQNNAFGSNWAITNNFETFAGTVDKAAYYAQEIGFSGSNTAGITFATGASAGATPTERMRITATGDVGIGTASPATALNISGDTNNTFNGTASITGNTLDVTVAASGTLAVGDRIYGTGIDYNTVITALGTGTGGTGTYTLNNSQTFSSGNIWASPARINTLRFTDIDGAARDGQPIGGIEFFGSDISTPAAGVKGYLAVLGESTTPDTAMVFGTSDNIAGTQAVERMRISSAGNVGIGTTSPLAKVNSQTGVSLSLAEQTYTGDAFFIGATGITAGINTYGSGITWSRLGGNGRRRAAIASVQTTADEDQVGLAFFTHPSTGLTVDIAESMRLDHNGNLGLGVTPSAWALSGLAAMQIKNASFFGYLNAAYMSANEFVDVAGASKYIVSSHATRYAQSAGTHAWFTAPSGTADNAITFTQRMTLDASGNLLVGTTSSGQGRLMVKQAASSVAGGLAIQATSNDSYLGLWNDGSVFNIEAYYNSTGSYQPIAFRTSNTERARITAGGDLQFATTDASPVTNNVAGIVFQSAGVGQFSSDGNPAIQVNRKTNDGDLVVFRQDGTQEGSISVSGNTVSYNPFMGSHYTEIVGTMPTLKGTVLESLDELVSNKYTLQDRLPKAKISDTVGSSAVYGVYFSPDSNPETDDGILAAALGASWVRIAPGVTVQRGDLLESNGDGCAKVQSDDIIRSKTIGKVTSTTVADTYADGSYIVPCVLYCG